MATRTLSQIIAELQPTYSPQIKSLQSQQALIPSRIAEQEKGLQAKQTQAFDTILGGARQRGLGFSGIPLAEQAKYTSTEFLPALANLRQQGNTERLSLQDAILGITERRNTLAQQLLQQERDRAEQKRQFNLSLQEQRASRAAAGSGGGGFSPSLGDLFGETQTDKKSSIGPEQARAWQSVQNFVGRGDKNVIAQDILRAYNNNKKNPNAFDRFKLEIYRAKAPQAYKAFQSLVNKKPTKKTRYQPSQLFNVRSSGGFSGLSGGFSGL